MGAAMCSEDGQCMTKHCGGSGRPTFEGVKEYEPQGKHDGLKESIEGAMPGAAAIGMSLDQRMHESSAAKELAEKVHDAEAAVSQAAKHTAEEGLMHSAAAAAASAMASVQAAAASALAKASDPGLEALEEPDAEADGAALAREASELKGRGFDPVQAAAWNMQGATARAKAELLEIGDYVHRGHFTLRCFCLAVAGALLASSVVGVLNLFDVRLKPFQYLVAAYNVVFAGVILVVDVKSVIPGRCVDIRKKIFQACWFLSSHRGKAMFYFYVGSINLVMLPDGDLRLIYLGTGGALCFAGLWILTDGFGYCCRKQSRASQAATAVTNGAASVLDKAHEVATYTNMEYVKVKSYVQSHPMTLKLICFLISLVLLASSVMGMLNIFSAFFQPFHYLMAAYNMIFAVVIALLDGRREWFERCWDVRKKLLKAAPCLGWLAGRAMFFFYVGSINLAMLPDSVLWRYIYIGIGGALCAAGMLMLLHRYVCRSKDLDDLMGFKEET